MKNDRLIRLLSTYILFVTLISIIFLCLNPSTNVSATQTNHHLMPNVIIDAGHGGEDGGAISCTDIPESRYNLEISLRVNDLFRLLGIKTLMTRKTDQDKSTEGQTIAQRKASDLKNRVKIINSATNSVLMSIHQNHYTDNRYSGAQVFYAQTAKSKKLAAIIQSNLKIHLQKENTRKIKPCNNIYIMDRVNCPAILIECGFLSNEAEELLLRNAEYQKKLTAIICVSYFEFLDHEDIY